MKMRHFKCTEPRPESPRLPPSHIQAFQLLRQLAEINPGQMMPIGKLEDLYGNPNQVVRTLRCKYGWDIETHEEDSPANTRVTDGYYYLTPEHHAQATALLNDYYAKGGAHETSQ